MDGTSVGVLALVATNIGAVAYSYGKLNQKVTDICRRLDKIEKAVNNKPNSDSKYTPG